MLRVTGTKEWQRRTAKKSARVTVQCVYCSYGSTVMGVPRWPSRTSLAFGPIISRDFRLRGNPKKNFHDYSSHSFIFDRSNFKDKHLCINMISGLHSGKISNN